MNKSITSSAPHSPSSLGQWIARCGPKGKPAAVSLVVLYILVVAGLAVTITGVLVQPKPGNETLRPIFIAGGGAVVAICLLCHYAMVFSRHPQVDLYTQGIHFQSKSENELVPWNRTQKVLIMTFYETWYSSYRSVDISLTDGRSLSFTSKLQGESDRVIDGIAHNAPNVELKEVSLG